MKIVTVSPFETLGFVVGMRINIADTSRHWEMVDGKMVFYPRATWRTKLRALWVRIVQGPMIVKAIDHATGVIAIGRKREKNS